MPSAKSLFIVGGIWMGITILFWIVDGVPVSGGIWTAGCVMVGLGLAKLADEEKAK